MYVEMLSRIIPASRDLCWSFRSNCGWYWGHSCPAITTDDDFSSHPSVQRRAERNETSPMAFQFEPMNKKQGQSVPEFLNVKKGLLVMTPFPPRRWRLGLRRWPCANKVFEQLISRQIKAVFDNHGVETSGGSRLWAKGAARFCFTCPADFSFFSHFFFPGPFPRSATGDGVETTTETAYLHIANTIAEKLP